MERNIGTDAESWAWRAEHKKVRISLDEAAAQKSTIFIQKTFKNQRAEKQIENLLRDSLDLAQWVDNKLVKNAG